MNITFDRSLFYFQEQSNETINRSKLRDQKKYFFAALIIGILCISIWLATFISNDFDTDSPGDQIEIRIKFKYENQKVSSLVADFEEETLPGDKSVIIVPKTRWITQVGGQRLNDVKLPAQKVIIAHTATSNCSIRV